MLTAPCGHRLYGPSSLASTAYTQLYRCRPGCRGDEVYRPLSYQLPNSKLASLRIALPRSSSSPRRFLSETSARQSLLSCTTGTLHIRRTLSQQQTKYSSSSNGSIPQFRYGLSCLDCAGLLLCSKHTTSSSFSLRCVARATNAPKLSASKLCPVRYRYLALGHSLTHRSPGLAGNWTRDRVSCLARLLAYPSAQF